MKAIRGQNMSRIANSQAGWAVITQGVTSARVQVHRLRHLVNRLVELAKDPRYAELLARLIGDVISAGPDRISRLEDILDRTSYALAVMGEEHLKGRLPLKDLTDVDEALEGSSAFGSPRERFSSDVARWYARRVSIRQARRHA